MARRKLPKDEVKRIKLERKKLKKELKEKGIKSRQEFELTARELGLVLDDGSQAGGLLGWLRQLVGWIKFGFNAKWLFASMLLFLGSMFLLAALTERMGNFTINLTGGMLRDGFVLCDNDDFKKPQTRLSGEKEKDTNCISIEDLPEDVNEKDGSHNGQNYIAYTFYIMNSGTEPNSYVYELTMDSSSKSVQKGIWLMLFEDDKQSIYTWESKDGDPEELYGYSKAPFSKMAADKKQYYEENGAHGIVTIPYADKKTVARGMVVDVEPKEIHKYTIAIWIEGNDPDSTNELIGGHSTFSMNFSLKDEKDHNRSIFNGVYRDDYESYENGKTEK